MLGKKKGFLESFLQGKELFYGTSDVMKNPLKYVKIDLFFKHARSDEFCS